MDNMSRLIILSSSSLLVVAIIVIILYATGVIKAENSTPATVPATTATSSTPTTVPMVIPVTTTTAPTVTPAPYKNLCNKHNKCVAIAENGNTPGQQAIQWDKNTDENAQLWSLHTTGHICNKHDLCLSVSSGNNGELVIQDTKKDVDNQKWKFSESGNVCNKLTNYTKCMAARANTAENGAGLIQWDLSTEEGQNWSFI